jgi:hypothetical protein
MGLFDGYQGANIQLTPRAALVATMLYLSAADGHLENSEIDDLLKKTISAGCLTPSMQGMVLRAHGAKLTARRDPDDDTAGSTTGFKLRSLAVTETYDLGGLDVAALEQTLARMPRILNTEESRARTGAPQHASLEWNGKTYRELSFAEKHQLATEDYAHFKAMRATAEAEGEVSP